MLDEWNRYEDEYGSASGGNAGGSSTNPFDSNFDDATTSSSSSAGGVVSGGRGGSAVSGAAPESARPMFNIEKLEWWPTAEQGPVVSMDVGNNVLLIGTANNFVVRWNVDSDSLDEILLTTKKDERIHKVFIDAAGAHALIAMGNGVTYYLPARRDKPVLLAKLKGALVESVGWFALPNDPRSVQRAMLGTSRGVLHELVLEDGKEKSCKRLFDLVESGVDASASSIISACHVEAFPASAPIAPGAAASTPFPRLFAMVATPTRYYEFVGGPTLEAVFAKQGPNLAFVELPGSLGYSELRFRTSSVTASSGSGSGGSGGDADSFGGSSSANAHGATAQTSSTSSSFAWLTAAGLFQGKLRFGTQAAAGDRVVCDGSLVEYPLYPDTELLQQLEAQGVGVGVAADAPRLAPLSMVLTAVHYLLLFKNRLIAINQLSKEIVFDCVLPRREMGVPRRLAYDPRHDTVWLCTDRHVFEVEIADEARDVWAIHLAQGDYALAARAARTPAQRDQVLTAHADALFRAGRYSEAAVVYAGSSRSFEEVTLKFVGSRAQAMFHTPTTTAAAAAAAAASAAAGAAASAGSGDTSAGSNAASAAAAASGGPLVPLPFAASPLATPAAARDALKAYLRAKLRTIDNADLTQLTMVCVWLLEIYLDTINSFAEKTTTTSASATAAAAAGGSALALPLHAAPGTGTGNAAAAAASGSAAAAVAASSSAAGERAAAAAAARAEAHARAVDEFREFVDEYHDCLPRDTTLDLIGSHGLVAEMLYFATAVHDAAFVLDHNASHGRHDAALALLAQHSAGAARPETAELFYRFIPQLIVPRPEETVDLLVRTPALDPVQLIPALLRCGLQVYPDGAVALAPGSALLPRGTATADYSAVATALNGGAPAAANAANAIANVSHALAASKRGPGAGGAAGAGAGGVASSALARATEAKLAKLGASAIVSAGSSAVAAAKLRASAASASASAANAATALVAGHRGANTRHRVAGHRGGRHSDDDDYNDEDGNDDEDDDEPTLHSQQVCRYLRHVISATAAGANTLVLNHLYLILLSRLRSETPLLDFVSSALETSAAAAAASSSIIADGSALANTAVLTTTCGSAPRFDLNFALRTARSAPVGARKPRTCVALLCHMRLYRDAVALALDVGVGFAKETIQAARAQLAGQPELLKQLWLAFAQSLIRKAASRTTALTSSGMGSTGSAGAGAGAGAVLAELRSVESGLFLEDVLPLFPDFATLGEFKADILSALGEYTDQIAGLKQEMDTLTAAASQIRHDLHQLHHRAGAVSARQRCDLCTQPVALRAFLLYPCTHAFHEECARAAVVAHLNSTSAAALAGGAATHGQSQAPSAAASAAAALSALPGLAALGSGRKAAAFAALLEDVGEDSALVGLKALLANSMGAPTAEQEAVLVDECTRAQCVLCGDVTMQSVVEPLVDAAREAEEIESWVI